MYSSKRATRSVPFNNRLHTANGERRITEKDLIFVAPGPDLGEDVSCWNTSPLDYGQSPEDFRSDTMRDLVSARVIGTPPICL
jgi:hypothetical protein